MAQRFGAARSGTGSDSTQKSARMWSGPDTGQLAYVGLALF